MHTRTWTLNSAVPLVSCEWGEAHFIFHCESGQTHFINETCANVLSLIAKESRTTDEIYRRMLANYEIDEDDELREAIEQVSALLERLGVISSKA